MPVEWYAVYAKHQHEKTVSAMLERKGFLQFLPVYHAVHRWKDRNQRVVLPLFPCYVFVKMDLSRKLEVLQTAGVRWFVESGGHACPIPDQEIDAIHRVCNSGVHVEPHPFLKQGDTVKLKAGPLAGLEGILTQVKNEHRIVLSVEMLKRSIAIEVDLSSVEIVRKANPNTLRPMVSAG